jgi:hypothetical protein
MLPMLKKIWLLFFAAVLMSGMPSCKSNKIPCPTYADSFPEKKAKKGKQKPEAQKPTKAKSSVLPPGYKAPKTNPG